MNIRIKNWSWDEAAYMLTEDFIWDSGDRDVFYASEDGWLRIVAGEWKIKKGFKWNGTTAWTDKPYLSENEIINIPVKSLSGHPIPKTWKETLLHDIGCVLVYEKEFPYTRKEVDKMFYKNLKTIKEFNHTARFYYLAVRAHGIVSRVLYSCLRIKL